MPKSPKSTKPTTRASTRARGGHHDAGGVQSPKEKRQPQSKCKGKGGRGQGKFRFIYSQPLDRALR